jgi:predicted acyl esterase
VRSTVPDSDFILRVSDVYPDGRSMLLMDYPLRARYREGFEKQRLLTPGEPALLRWQHRLDQHHFESWPPPAHHCFQHRCTSL